MFALALSKLKDLARSLRYPKIMNTLRTILSFDIGHESIGWAAIREPETSETSPNVLAAGTVIFEKENCQNQQRAAFRRQRRHIAATRNRIRRLERVLLAIGLLTEEEIAEARKPKAARPHPWLLAARILQGHATSSQWHELWPVLRWYAHNRGYDGNSRWARTSSEDGSEDTEKVEKANALMTEYGTSTMAETICAFLGVDPASKLPPVPGRYFKGQNAAFRRSVVEGEVRRILQANQGTLTGLDDDLIEGLVGSSDDAWEKLRRHGVRLPQRYAGSLLFGQMVPRFDNRIIPACRITGSKTPDKDCAEFYRYRWAMLLNNLRVAGPIENTSRPLTAQERQSLNGEMRRVGFFTKSSLKAACGKAEISVPTNLDQMFMIPEMERALILDPSLRETNRGVLKHVWPTLPEIWKKRFLNKLRRSRNRPTCLADWRELLARSNEDLAAFDAAISQTVAEKNKRKGKVSKVVEASDILHQGINLADRASGRAPYTRELMERAHEWVLSGKDPKAKGGPLEETSEVIARQLNQTLAGRTNNHLVRHRMQIFGRLLDQCIGEFCANGSPPHIVIEVVRELQEFSGKTAQEKARMMGQKLAGHRRAVKFLEEKRAELGGFEVNAGLIKKVRIAQDLDWRCPFTGKTYSLSDILEGRVDREHIIPRSWRASDSLDSLVLTFREINQRKGQRLAWTFIADEGGGDLFTTRQFEGFVDRLKPRYDPRKSASREVIDDDLRRWRRKQLLLTQSFETRGADTATGFTAGDLTRTSFLNKIAAQEALGRLVNRIDPKQNRDPREIAAHHITQLPGSVTGAARRAWRLEGCLSPLVASSRALNKTELRGETHLHHSMDAIAAGLACFYFPGQGEVWGLLSRRKLSPSQAAILRNAVRLPVRVSNQGSWQIDDLPDSVKNQIQTALGEQRVVQHLPRTFRGLKVQQNVWRIVGPDPKHPQKYHLTQVMRDENQKRVRKHGSEKSTKLLGYVGRAKEGKLAKLKGALVVDSNYGVVLASEPKVIPHLKVWSQIQDYRINNNGQLPPILRNGSIISVPQQKGPKPYKYSGRWRVRSIKDAAQDVLLDLSPVHAIKATAINIRLKTLLKNGMKIERSDLLGSIEVRD